MSRLSQLLVMLQSGPMTRRQIADAFGIKIENVSGLVQQGIASGLIDKNGHKMRQTFSLRRSCFKYP